jgi:4-hydroxybenzoate polyprenyltransferase
MKRAQVVQILLASRPISWVNTAYPFAAGVIMTQRHVSAVLIIGSLFFLIPYNLMMYGVNDVFDFESDIRNPRKGGLEGVQLARANHRTLLISVVVVNLPFIIALLLLSRWLCAIILGLVVFFVLAYSLPRLRFKERPVLDSITSSVHFVGPLIYGLSLTPNHLHGTYLLIIGAFFLWGMASHAFGAVQDIVADRKANIASIATALGAQRTVWLSLSLYLSSALVLLTLGWYSAICALVAIAYALNVVPYVHLSDKHAEQANRGWKHFIALNGCAGFVVTMVLIYLYRQ